MAGGMDRGGARYRESQAVISGADRWALAPGWVRWITGGARYSESMGSISAGAMYSKSRATFYRGAMVT